MARSFTEGNPFKLILGFAIPMLIGNVFQQLYSTVDSIIVGNFEGPQALAAISSSFSVQFLLLAIAFGFSIGMSTLMAQVYGANEMDKVKKTFSTGFILIISLAICLAVIGYLITDPVLMLLQTPEHIMPDSSAYLKIMFVGLPATFVYNFYAQALRAIGDSKTPLYFLMFATLLNIVLDYVFVAYFGWGVSGVAIATITAQAVSGILSYLYVNKRIAIFQFEKGEFVFDKELAKGIIRFGLPAAIQQSIFSLGFLAVQGMVNSYGEDMMAAFGATGRIEGFVTMPMMNLATALSMFAGQNIGANREDRAMQGIKDTAKIQVVFCAIMFFVIPPAAEMLLVMFGLDQSPNALALGIMGTRFTVYFYIVFALFQTFNQFHRGVGDATYSMFVSFAMIAIRVPVTYALSVVWPIGEISIWIGMVTGWSVSFVLNLIRFLSGKWRGKAFVQKDIKPAEAEAQEQ